MGAHITARTKCLCGHLDLFSFSSSGRVGRLEDRLYASSTLCGPCRTHIAHLMQPQGKGFYPLTLAQLVGRPRSVTWAKSIRLAHVRSLGPMMAHLKNISDPMAAAALAVFEMLFKVTDSQFWIAGREFAYGSEWVTSEIEHLMRRRFMSMHSSSLSAYCYWMRTDTSVIREALFAAESLLTAASEDTTSGSLQPTLQPSAPNSAVFL